MVTPVKKVPIHLQSAQNRLLIKGGSVVNGDGIELVDIYVEDSIIKQMGQHLIIPGGTRVIDASGKYVLPGGIDASVHFQTPFRPVGDADHPEGTVTIDNFYQGTKAALAGGTTTVIDCVIPDRGETLLDAYHKWRGWAEDKVCCDYALRVALPSSPDSSVWQELEELSGSELGVNTFHLSMAGERRLNDKELLHAFEECAKLGALAQVYAENGEIVERNCKKLLERGVTGPEGYASAHSESAEEEACVRATTLAHLAGCPLYVCTVTGKSTADAIRYKKSRGNVLYSEVTPAALACDGAEYWNPSWRHAAGFVCAPPLRRGQRDALLDACCVKDGAAFDAIASDHATFNAKQKAFGTKDFTKIPPGVNGVESRMSVLWELGVQSGKMTPERFVDLTSALPAKLFNLYPDKGRLQVGSMADIVVWNSKNVREISKDSHNLKVDMNVFEGMQCHGIPETVIHQGKVMVDEGRVRVMQGFGRFLALRPFAPYIYDKVRANKDEMESLQGVTRSEEDMIIRHVRHTNGTAVGADGDGTQDDDEEDIPLPTPKKSLQPEKAPSQQESNIDLKDHPYSSPSEFDQSCRSTPQRASVKVRAPPGGKSSGGFW